MKSLSKAAIVLATTLLIGSLAACSTLTSPARATSSISDSGPEETGGIGVNAYLWRASLDTLDFMPLESADPWGGVIITEWYANPAKADERFKMTVYILDTRLRADGISVTVFRETLNEAGAWATATVNPDTRVAIENAILARARELRLSTIDDE